MKYYPEKTIAERLDQSRETLNNVRTDTEMLDILAGFGYGEVEFTEGSRRLEVARQLDIDQQVHIGAQVSATAVLDDLYRAIRRQYVDDRQLVRNILRDDRELFTGLRLHLRIRPSRDGFILQATHFYDEVVTHSSVQQALTGRYQIPAVSFDRQRGQLVLLTEAIDAQQQRIGQAQVTTVLRREAMKELDTWMLDFIRTARLAFRGNSRHLRKLGITVRDRSQSS